MAKNRIRQTELYTHLREQLEFLKQSCQNFDQGMYSEAKRMAVNIRILAHDTSNSNSLFNQLAIKNKIKYIDTAFPFNDKNLLTHLGLVSLCVSCNKGTYKAKLNDSPIPPKFKKFNSWWEGDIIIKDDKGNLFTRKQLILTMANKDGGAHIDSLLEEDYFHLTRENGAGWSYTDNNTTTGIDDIELHSVRQIAYEFIQSIEQYLSTNNIVL